MKDIKERKKDGSDDGEPGGGGGVSGVDVRVAVRAEGGAEVEDAGGVDAEGGGVSGDPRRAHAGRHSSPQPGLLRHHVDGA